jgi:hypothetical protein
MPVAEKATVAVDWRSLKLPASVRPERVEVEDYIDTTGDPSLWVLVVFEESVDIDQISGADVVALKSAIRDRLLEQGINEFAYITLAKPSELVDVEEESEED